MGLSWVELNPPKILRPCFSLGALAKYSARSTPTSQFSPDPGGWQSKSCQSKANKSRWIPRPVKITPQNTTGHEPIQPSTRLTSHRPNSSYKEHPAPSVFLGKNASDPILQTIFCSAFHFPPGFPVSLGKGKPGFILAGSLQFLTSLSLGFVFFFP